MLRSYMHPRYCLRKDSRPATLATGILDPEVSHAVASYDYVSAVRRPPLPPAGGWIYGELRLRALGTGLQPYWIPALVPADVRTYRETFQAL